MGIVLTDFQGEMPGVSNYDLPVNAASEAINCEFGGTVRPARFFSTTPDTSTAGWPVQVYGQWFNADTPNGIVPSPMADDSIDRMYRLSAGKLQRALLSSPSSWTNVGIESPSVPFVVEVVQQITQGVPAGIAQKPVGVLADYSFMLAYSGFKNGVGHFSNTFNFTVAGYTNSLLVLKQQPNFQSSIEDVRTKLRANGWTATDVASVRITLFIKRNNVWVPTAAANSDSSIPIVGSGRFDEPAITTATYNANKMMVNGAILSAPPAPIAYTAVMQGSIASNAAVEVDVPESEVGMSRAYVYTVCRIVADNNGTAVVEEGPPSLPVIVENVFSNTKIKITFSSAVPSGYQFAIYRAHAGMYLYVGDCAAGARAFDDIIPDAALGEECPSLDWLPPPTLDGFVSTGYGFFVGWKGNRVYCSEVYLPHAWPSAYGYTTKYNIKRCIAIHNGILAITDNGNYFISGSTPQGLNLIEMPTFHPCIAVNTAVDMGDGVVYVAPTGLALTNASGSKLLTEGAIDPSWWSGKAWSTAYAYRAADMYVLSVGGERWVFNMRTKTISRGTGLPARATFDQATGALKTPNGSVLPSSFATSYKWKSKIFEFNNGQTYGWTQCIATKYPVSVKWHLWQNDGVKTERVVSYNDHHPVRFPPNRWHMVQVEINSANPVSRISVTSNRQELEYVG